MIRIKFLVELLIAYSVAGKDLIGQKGCDMLLMTSKPNIFKADNVIVSPNYPSVYPKGTICKYEFVGLPNERIQIDFVDFSLPSDNLQCYYSDTLEVYMVRREKYEPTDILCGTQLIGPILSNSNRLLIEFRGIYSGTGFRGFKFQYSFVTNYGITTGHQLGTNCSFEFFSNATRNGTFQSPNFPGIYPKNIECSYYFYASDNETVELRFSYFDIEGVFPCDDYTSSDSVEFSNYIARDRKYGFHCGKTSEFTIKSDGKFFRVTFRSNDKLDGTGFIANYRFVSMSREKTTVSTQIAIKSASATIFHCSVMIPFALMLIISN